jgi:GAF domain-containing protein
MPHDTEPARLAALRRYAVLDTPPERAFDDLARVASLVCGTPIAVVSLVDESRQWFKARVGIDAEQTPREVAFCDHAIRDPAAVMVVPDAAADDRFRHNPLVTGAPHIRFYAGAPLVDPDGHPLGTLCAIDRRPRELTAVQREALAALARQVMTELELRRAGAELAAALDQVRRLESLVVMCAWTRTVQMDGRWVSVEEFLRAKVGVRVSHGVSDEALARLEEIAAGGALPGPFGTGAPTGC